MFRAVESAITRRRCAEDIDIKGKLSPDFVNGKLPIFYEWVRPGVYRLLGGGRDQVVEQVIELKQAHSLKWQVTFRNATQ